MAALEIKGIEAIVDDEDLEILRAFPWQRVKAKKVYFQARINGQLVYLHRLLTNATKGLEVDHINGNTLDNRKSNLRLCTSKENRRNQALRRDNLAGLKGVSMDKRRMVLKFTARIKTDSGTIYLGGYKTPEEAHAAYCEASKKYHGDFGRTS